MFAVLAVDFFLLSGGHWDTSEQARSRWPMLLPWAAGFIVYQLINPGYLSWWVSAWTWIRHQIGFTPASWMSASIGSFLVAAMLTLAGGWTATLIRHHRYGTRPAQPGLDIRS